MKNLAEKILIGCAIVGSISAWYWSFTNNYVMTYNDGASHLNIARRVVDNLTPGIAQIGTVWLPLPHLLMLPLAINDFLWHTAIAGSLVSMAAFVISVFLVYKTLLMLTQSKFSSTAGALILLFNPNLLYLQTTPMTEPLLMMTFALASYYFVKYMQTDSVADLVLTGAAVSLVCLTRYDGWFLFLCMLAIIPIHALIKHGRRKAEGRLFLFAGIGGLGIMLWLLWNQMIFKDALYFMSGPYSAAAQQKVLDTVGQLPTKGNWLTAGTYFWWAMIDNNGGLIFALAGIGVLGMLIWNKNHSRYLAGLLVSPIIFNIIALYLGQSAMNIPQAVNNPGYFNTRYGLLTLPGFAIAIGMLISKTKWLKYTVPVLFAVQTWLFVTAGTPITLTDGLLGLKNTYYTVEASRWLADNYQGGLILTSLASHDAFVARTGLAMKNYIHEGTRENWQNALKNPSGSATYITVLTNPPDSVYREIADNPDFRKKYKLVHNYEKFEIYKLK